MVITMVNLCASKTMVVREKLRLGLDVITVRLLTKPCRCASTIYLTVHKADNKAVPASVDHHQW